MASFGCAGDDPDRELEAIMSSLAEALRGDVAPRLLVNESMPVTTNDLFVPAHPATLRLESPERTHRISMLDVRTLFAMAGSQQLAVALCAYLDEAPVTVLLHSLEP